MDLRPGQMTLCQSPSAVMSCAPRLRAGQAHHLDAGGTGGKEPRRRPALEELQRLYDSLDRDLVERASCADSVRDRFRDFGPATVSMMIRASGHVGAIWSDALKLMHSAWRPIRSTCRARRGLCHDDGAAGGLSVGGVRPNRTWRSRCCQMAAGHPLSGGTDGGIQTGLCWKSFRSKQYFTMAYADVDLRTGKVRLAQAGHPHPVVMRAEGG